MKLLRINLYPQWNTLNKYNRLTKQQLPVSPTNRSPTNNTSLIVAITMTQVADPPPCCRSQPIVSTDVYRRPPPSTRCDADTTRCWSNPPPPTWRTATQCSCDTNCRRNATRCRLETSPTRCDADKVGQCRPVEVDPLRCRWRAVTISWSMRYRTVDDLLRHTTSPYSLLIDLKQAGLLTDRFYIPSVNFPVDAYAASIQYSSLLAVVSRSRRLTQIREILLQLQQTVARLNLFCRMSTRLCQNSAVKHTLILKKKSNRISSHLTSLPYQTVRTDSWILCSSAYGLTVRSNLSMFDS